MHACEKLLQNYALYHQVLCQRLINKYANSLIRVTCVLASAFSVTKACTRSIIAHQDSHKLSYPSNTCAHILLYVGEYTRVECSGEWASVGRSQTTKSHCLPAGVQGMPVIAHSQYCGTRHATAVNSVRALRRPCADVTTQKLHHVHSQQINI